MANLTEEALRDILVLFQEVKQDLKSWRNELQTKTMANQGLPVKPMASSELIASTSSTPITTPPCLPRKHIASSPVIPMTLTISPVLNPEPKMISFLPKATNPSVPRRSVTRPPIIPTKPPISPEPPDPPFFNRSGMISTTKAAPKMNKSKTLLKYSCEEIEEMMTNGLCIFCGEQDTNGHQNLKHKGAMISVIDEDEMAVEETGSDDKMSLKQAGYASESVNDHLRSVPSSGSGNIKRLITTTSATVRNRCRDVDIAGQAGQDEELNIENSSPGGVKAGGVGVVDNITSQIMPEADVMPHVRSDLKAPISKKNTSESMEITPLNADAERANDLDSDETKNTSVELSLERKFVTVRGRKVFEENMLDIVKLSCQVKEGEELIREHLNEPGSSKAVSDQIKARNQAAEEHITALRCLQSTFATATAYYKHLNVSIKRFPMSIILDAPLSQSQLHIYNDVEMPQDVSAIGSLVCTKFMLITMSCWRKLLRTRRKHKWSKLWRFRSKDKLKSHKLTGYGIIYASDDIAASWHHLKNSRDIWHHMHMGLLLCRTIPDLTVSRRGLKEDCTEHGVWIKLKMKEHTSLTKYFELKATSERGIVLQIPLDDCYKKSKHVFMVIMVLEQVKDIASYVEDHTSLNDTCMIRETSCCITHETNHTISDVWHRWKNKKIAQAVSVLIMFNSVSAPSSGTLKIKRDFDFHGRSILDMSLGSLTGTFHSNVRVFHTMVLRQWKNFVILLIVIARSSNLWSGRYIAEKNKTKIYIATFVEECSSVCRLLFGAFMMNILARLNRDCDFSVLIAQWKENPPDTIQLFILEDKDVLKEGVLIQEKPMPLVI